MYQNDETVASNDENSPKQTGEGKLMCAWNTDVKKSIHIISRKSPCCTPNENQTAELPGLVVDSELPCQ